MLRTILNKLREKRTMRKAWKEVAKESLKKQVIKKEIKDIEREAKIELGLLKEKKKKGSWAKQKMRMITVKSGFKKAPYPTGKVTYGRITGHDTSHLDTGSIIPRQPPRRIRWA